MSDINRLGVLWVMVMPSSCHQVGPSLCFENCTYLTETNIQKSEIIFTMDLQPTLSNSLITLRPLNLDDFESLYKVSSDPKLWEQHPRSNRYRREVFQELFEQRLSSNGAFVIVDEKTNEVIGSTGFYEYDEKNHSVVIGYTFISRKYWGTGVNKEIKKLMIDYALQFVKKVLFHIGETNMRSRKAIEKIGAVEDGSFDKENIDGTPRKVVTYKIVKESFD